MFRIVRSSLMSLQVGLWKGKSTKHYYVVWYKYEDTVLENDKEQKRGNEFKLLM